MRVGGGEPAIGLAIVGVAVCMLGAAGTFMWTMKEEDDKAKAKLPKDADGTVLPPEDGVRFQVSAGAKFSMSPTVSRYAAALVDAYGGADELIDPRTERSKVFRVKDGKERFDATLTLGPVLDRALEPGFDDGDGLVSKSELSHALADLYAKTGTGSDPRLDGYGYDGMRATEHISTIVHVPKH